MTMLLSCHANKLHNLMKFCVHWLMTIEMIWERERERAKEKEKNWKNHTQNPSKSNCNQMTLPINIFTCYYLIGLKCTSISTIFLSVHSQFIFDANFCISKNKIARAALRCPTNKQQINQIIMSRLFTCN